MGNYSKRDGTGIGIGIGIGIIENNVVIFEGLKGYGWCALCRANNEQGPALRGFIIRKEPKSWDVN